MENKQNKEIIENQQVKWVVVDDQRYLPSYSERVNYWGIVDNIYVMDNHRCALYHWIKKIQSTLNIIPQFHYLHIDAHYDAFDDQNTEAELDALLAPQLTPIEYLELENKKLEKKLVRWDNYLPIFYKLFGGQIKSSHFFTQKIGVPPVMPSNKPHLEYGPWQLLDFLQKISRTQMDETPWLVNIDLDYFFHRSLGGVYFETKFVELIFLEIEKLQKSHLIYLIDLVTSPECCGDQEKVHMLLKNSLKLLGNKEISHPVHFW